MKILIVAFVLLGLLLSVSSEDTCNKNKCLKAVRNDPCGLTGKWKNGLGSTVEFTCNNGELNGRYNSAVGAATDFYNLTRRYTMSGPNEDVTVVGWTVAWNNAVRGNSNSTTSWTGLYYPNTGCLFTQFILVRYVDQSNLWQSSYVYHDTFERDCEESYGI